MFKVGREYAVQVSVGGDKRHFQGKLLEVDGSLIKLDWGDTEVIISLEGGFGYAQLMD